MSQSTLLFSFPDKGQGQLGFTFGLGSRDRRIPISSLHKETGHKPKEPEPTTISAFNMHPSQMLITVSLAAFTAASLEGCLSNVCAGRSDCVAYPDILDPLYQLEWVKPYNLAIGVNPAAVIRPNSSEDVAAIVQCAVDNGVKVQAKSGGHSYANFGLGNDAITMDLVNLQQYSMNQTTWYATIGAGMTLGDVDANLHKTGRAFAHGVCPGVGIGGHATIVSLTSMCLPRPKY